MKLDLVIVDDSPVWLSISKKLAEQHPLVRSVATFDDTLDAWIYIQTHKPNAIFTDVEMPGMDGMSFLYMFARRIPMISSSTQSRFASQSEELGSTGFLSKPFSKKDFDQILTKVHSALSHRTYTVKRDVDLVL